MSKAVSNPTAIAQTELPRRERGRELPSPQEQSDEGGERLLKHFPRPTNDADPFRCFVYNRPRRDVSKANQAPMTSHQAKTELRWPGWAAAWTGLALAIIVGTGAAPAQVPGSGPAPSQGPSQLPAVAGSAAIPGFWDPRRRPERPDLSRITLIRFLTEFDYPPFNYAGPGRQSGRLQCRSGAADLRGAENRLHRSRCAASIRCCRRWPTTAATR